MSSSGVKGPYPGRGGGLAWGQRDHREVSSSCICSRLGVGVWAPGGRQPGARMSTLGRAVLGALSSASPAHPSPARRGQRSPPLELPGRGGRHLLTPFYPEAQRVAGHQEAPRPARSSSQPSNAESGDTGPHRVAGAEGLWVSGETAPGSRPCLAPGIWGGPLPPSGELADTFCLKMSGFHFLF